MSTRLISTDWKGLVKPGDSIDLRIAVCEETYVERVDVMMYVRDVLPAVVPRVEITDSTTLASYNEAIRRANERLGMEGYFSERADPKCPYCGGTAHRMHSFRNREVCCGCGAGWEE